ncbi:hypothetical protein ACJ73_00491 [Blastomyces percursus]|uniref:Transcription factor IIIC 90kDa subunit N-terminal domain-containing protein n=1 Tax=Blastomyces percursus TaxID=1658174 RepID=A0A1J9QGX7_9EURO|nr:hypothetical protein ACJ73_00491 [Blastomyces percursus]
MTLDPVELKLFPSCFDCISWSPDGELAVALGENVHVLIPRIKVPTSAGAAETASTSNTQWTTTKFRANIFTNKEWPMIFPQQGETFSLGEEQSISHVVALAWSPHCLTKYSRHALAVLTSNLVLSLWELADGQSKWVRSVVVNSALRDAFGPSLQGKSSILQRKQHVRSFCWSPKCDDDRHDKGSPQGHLAYRNMSLLVVANDMNDITMIRVRNDRRGSDKKARRKLWVEVISHTEIRPPAAAYPRGNPRHTSPIVIIQATEVKVFLLHAKFEQLEGEEEGNNTDARLNLQLSEAIPISQDEQFQRMSFYGPLRWIDRAGHENSPSSRLAVGYLGGYVVITLDDLFVPEPTARGRRTSNISFYHALRADIEEDNGSLEWEPITAITSTTDTQSHIPVLHVAQFSSSLRSLPLPAIQSQDVTISNDGQPGNPQSADLHSQIEGFRSRFDLDHDLGGMSVARIWGMTSHRGWVAGCFTVHPSDMVEYITTARERSRIVFAPPQPVGGASGEPREPLSAALPWDIPPQLTPKHTSAARANVLSFTLHENYRDLPNDPWVRKLRYAAICCLATDQCPADDPHVLEAAKSAAQWLSNTLNLDLSLELSLIDEKLQSQIQHPSEPSASPETNKRIPGKPREAQVGAGHDVFEFCDICGSGIDWYSAEESQCTEGHVFARCGLSFLSIQDPSISKRCSVCGGEVLDAELAEVPSVIEPEMETTGQSQAQCQEGGLLDILCETFDTCIYCGGKFRE